MVALSHSLVYASLNRRDVLVLDLLGVRISLIIRTQGQRRVNESDLGGDVETTYWMSRPESSSAVKGRAICRILVPASGEEMVPVGIRPRSGYPSVDACSRSVEMVHRRCRVLYSSGLRTGRESRGSSTTKSYAANNTDSITRSKVARNKV